MVFCPSCGWEGMLEETNNNCCPNCGTQVRYG